MQQPSAPRGTHHGARRYTIQSNFGNARTPRSRKNRPCDTCRRRKTACVITDKPPCLFCKSRGLQCISSAEVEAGSSASSTPATSSGLTPEDSRSTPVVALDPAAAAGPEGITPSPSSTGPQDEASRQDSGSPALVVHHRPAAASHHSSVIEGSQDGTLSPSQHRPEPTGPDDDDSDEALFGLEDIGDRTSHSMGLSCEQDAHFLGAFRSLLLSEQDEIDANIIQVHDGGSPPDSVPNHFLLLLNEFPTHTNNAVRLASDITEAKVFPHGPALVRLYFRFIHPVYPVVSKVRFLRLYNDRKLELPASLRAAVYALACIFWQRDASLPEKCPFEQWELIAEAHSALRRELEAPNLYKLQASLLLPHLKPPEIDSVETPSTWFMASQSTACAQMIGLHRDPTPWNIASWEKKLRKKLWWIVFASDCWASVCHGNPPHIGDSTYDTALPTVDDFRFDEDVPEDLHHLVDPENRSYRVSDGARFLESITLARALRSILDTSYQVKPNPSQDALYSIYAQFRDWPSLVPYCLTVGPGRENLNNGPLTLSYYASQVLLFRALMTPATRLAKADPTSNLSRWFPIAIGSFKPFVAFFSTITEENLVGFWGRHARSQLILCANFLIFLFVLATRTDDVSATYQLLDAFQQTLQRLSKHDNDSARLLVRPSALRVESFFQQAHSLLLKARETMVVKSPAPGT